MSLVVDNLALAFDKVIFEQVSLSLLMVRLLVFWGRQAVAKPVFYAVFWALIPHTQATFCLMAYRKHWYRHTKEALVWCFKIMPCFHI
mgnify:CR=1 FL=1